MSWPPLESSRPTFRRPTGAASPMPRLPCRSLSYMEPLSLFPVRSRELCPHTSLASQDQVFSYWTGPQANRCRRATSNTFCTNLGRSPTNVTERQGTICNGRTAVTRYELIGGDHEWYNIPMNDPTKTPYNPSFANPLPGIVTDDILWNFFAAHPKNVMPACRSSRDR